MARRSRLIHCARQARQVDQGARRRISIRASGQDSAAQTGRTHESNRSAHKTKSPCQRGRPHMNQKSDESGIPGFNQRGHRSRRPSTDAWRDWLAMHRVGRRSEGGARLLLAVGPDPNRATRPHELRSFTQPLHRCPSAGNISKFLTINKKRPPSSAQHGSGPARRRHSRRPFMATLARVQAMGSDLARSGCCSVIEGKAIKSTPKRRGSGAEWNISTRFSARFELWSGRRL